MIKLLLADDSALARSILKELFKDSAEIEVCCEASNGEKALELNKIYRPDIILMDIDMPLLDGLQATKKIMSSKPIPIIIFSNKADKKNSFLALEYGALEVLKKPDFDEMNSRDYREFLFQCVKNLALKNSVDRKKNNSGKENVLPDNKYKVILIGTSTGGPKALHYLFSSLPENFPLPVVVVQHIDESFAEGFSAWLNSESKLNIHYAKNNEALTPGNVYLAPAGRHLLLENGRLALKKTDRVNNQIPSVDVLFSSAAKSYGKDCLAFLLTGMGSDGAKGCLELKKSGALCIAQDEESSTIFGMPKAALTLGAVDGILSLEEIKKYLLNLVKAAD